ncbi:MAG: sulfotransferase [Cyanobacteria bacterium P01_F01_bin.4]
MSQASTASPIFIVGRPRSGTTLISTLISAHPSIAISPESHFLRYWMRSYASQGIEGLKGFNHFWSEFSQSADFSHFGISPDQIKHQILSGSDFSSKAIFNTLLTAYAHKLSKHRWGEKTPEHYRDIETLLKWYPQAQIIWMLRDPRGQIASLRVVPWAEPYEDLHATSWKNSISAMEHWASDRRVQIVKYEALVTDPEKTLQAVCNFLGEEYAPEMLNRSNETSPMINFSGWEEKHLQDTLKPINVKSISKWKSTLSPMAISIIEHVARPEMVRCDYEPVTETLNSWHSLKWFLMKGGRKLKRSITFAYARRDPYAFVDKSYHPYHEQAL